MRTISVVNENPLTRNKRHLKKFYKDADKYVKKIMDYNIIIGAIMLYCKPLNEADRRHRIKNGDKWLQYGKEILTELRQVSPNEEFKTMFEQILIPIIDFYKTLVSKGKKHGSS
jgi:hypothetical protein